MNSNLRLTLLIAFFSALIITACTTMKTATKTPEVPVIQEDEPEKHLEVDWSVSCVECHTEETPVAVEEWRNSAHGVMNFGCYMCHGDGEEEFYPRPGSEKCISCHSDNEIEFEKTPLNDCFDCHQGHTLKFHHEESE